MNQATAVTALSRSQSVLHFQDCVSQLSPSNCCSPTYVTPDTCTDNVMHLIIWLEDAMLKCKYTAISHFCVKGKGGSIPHLLLRPFVRLCKRDLKMVGFEQAGLRGWTLISSTNIQWAYTRCGQNKACIFWLDNILNVLSQTCSFPFSTRAD